PRPADSDPVAGDVGVRGSLSAREAKRSSEEAQHLQALQEAAAQSRLDRKMLQQKMRELERGGGGGGGEDVPASPSPSLSLSPSPRVSMQSHLRPPVHLRHHEEGEELDRTKPRVLGRPSALLG
ncbi:unnamed protein product, partial [Polarella glacialis]